MTRELDSTRGSTIPDSDDTGDEPKLETFDRPLERFELGHELGRGGMGRVVAATDVSLARSVAIKQVLSDRPDDLVRFEREVLITAQLEHPSIVPIHEAARDGEGRPYYVMRRIEGDPLSARITGTDLRTRLALLPNLLAVIDAAAFAHARKIIHRDIKPSNILLGAYGETHLIDWGLARKLDDLDVSGPRPIQGEQLTQVGHVYGTVGYMAPEQARGEPVDTRADVYALGATLFHVLAGAAPFAHLSDAERLSAAVTGDDRPPLEKLGDDIPAELSAIVGKAMATDRDVRYQHAGELATDLRAFLGGKLVAAHRYTASERLRRFVRRHRFAVALSGISLVIAIVVSIIAVRGMFEEMRVAESERREAMSTAEFQRIERASALASTDPTRAAALLRDLPTTTTHAARARDTIAKIAAYGIERGASVHTEPINGMAFSADLKSVASVSKDGLVVTYDAATGATLLKLDLKTPLYTVRWVAPTTLVVTSQQGGYFIDTTTKLARSFMNAAITNWWQVGDRIRYLDGKAKVVLEHPISGSKPTELARDVEWAEGKDELLVHGSRAGTFVDQTRLDGAPASVFSIAISPDKRRVALSDTTEIIEFDVATGRRTNSWKVRALQVRYGNGVLVSLGFDRNVRLLYANGDIEQHAFRTTPRWSAEIATGIAVGFEGGTIAVIDRAGVHRVEHAQSGMRAVGARPDAMWIATGSRDGTVRWLDLAAVTPPPIPLDPVGQLCTVTATHLYTISPASLVEIELATGKSRVIGPPEDTINLGVECVGSNGKHVIAWSPVGITVFDLVTRTARNIHDTTKPMFDGEHLVYASGATVFELESGGTSRSVYSAPSEIAAMVKHGSRLLVALGDHELRRVDLATGATASVRGESGKFGLLASGAAWFTDGVTLFRWDREVTRIGELPLPIKQVRPIDDDRYRVQLSDGSLWEVAMGEQRQRIGVGIRELVMQGDVALTWTESEVTVHFLPTGEQISRDMPDIARAILLPESAGIAVKVGKTAMLFHDPVPPTFPEAKRWLEQATNARFGAGDRTALGWQVAD